MSLIQLSLGDLMEEAEEVALEEPFYPPKPTPTCLRCGECCRVPEIDGVPGYEDGVKPAGERCFWLIGNIGQVMSCSLGQDDKPATCRAYNGHDSIGGCCDTGVRFWRAVQDFGLITEDLELAKPPVPRVIRPLLPAPSLR